MEPVPEPPLHLAEEMKKSIKSFKDDLRMFKPLCCPGLKERHIITINKMILQKGIINFILDTSKQYVIKNLKDSGLKNCVKEL